MKADEKRARQLVYQRSGGICEACGMQRAAEWQHRQPRSVGGQWSPANGLHLDSRCHAWITEHPKDANALGQHLFGWQDPAAEPVKVYPHGWVVLSDDGSITPTTAPDDPGRAAA